MDYNCKQNDVQLRIVKNELGVDEILVRSVADYGWTVIPYSDLLEAVKQAQTLKQRLDKAVFEKRLAECSRVEQMIYDELMQSYLRSSYDSGKLSIGQIKNKVPETTFQIKSALKHLADIGWIHVEKTKINRKLYFVNTLEIFK